MHRCATCKHAGVQRGFAQNLQESRNNPWSPRTNAMEYMSMYMDMLTVNSTCRSRGPVLYREAMRRCPRPWPPEGQMRNGLYVGAVGGGECRLFTFAGGALTPDTTLSKV